MVARKTVALAVIATFSAAVVAGALGHVFTHARAILVNPRLGTPLRAPSTSGTGLPGTFLDGTLSLWVGTDPADVPVPASWLDVTSWEVGLVPVVLENAPMVMTRVDASTPTTNTFVSYGGGDSSWLAQNAVRLDVSLPASIQPGTYDLHVGFGRSLATATTTILPGMHQGPPGSAGMFGTGFVLAEPGCVLVPWVNDSLPADAVHAAPVGYYKPWSLVHLSDIHFGARDDARLQLPASAVYTDAFRDALSILAPELLVATGDLTRDPFDRDVEYRLAYDWFRSVGIPVVMSNGNHDQKNMGLWPYYFGPQTSIIDWAGMTLVSFNSIMPISGQTASLIANQVQGASAANRPVFLACHIPLMDVLGRQTMGSAATIVDAMVRHNGTAILQGHNHYNVVMDAATALDRYLTLGDMKDACEFTTLQGEPLPAINGPKLIITSTVGYEGRDNLDKVWPSYIPVTGYRHVVMAGNRMVNYTYDMDGDGLRDPSYGHPVYDYTVNQSLFQNPLLNFSLAFDPLDIPAGANFTIFNNLTESIAGARVAVTLPINLTHRWQPDPALNAGLVIHERARFTNGTHEFIDFRVTVPRWSSVTVHLNRVP